MTSSSSKFEDFTKEERYKRLEQNLKVSLVRQADQVKTNHGKGYCTSPTWPELSSINTDGLDSSSAHGVPSLQVSRIGSEVVSFSSNLRKILSKNSGYINRLPMATSSVKKFPISENQDRDSAIMPPPPTNNLIFHNTKKLSKANLKHNIQNKQNNKIEIDNNVDESSIKISSASSAFQEDINNSISKSNAHNSKGYNIFSRWRILINDQGHLIIKGTLECGKVARSKPVVQRLTSTKVQSVYKHIYILDGNIVDDRNELPDYVRGKFHNGFPDDWENVYQIWRNYIVEGSKITFRWPTPITDSDDDLNSEITEITCLKNNQIHSTDHGQSSKNAYSYSLSLGYHSKIQSDSNQNLEKSKEEINEIKTKSLNQNVDDSGHSSGVKNISNYNEESDAKNKVNDAQSTTANCSNTNSKYTSYLSEIIREEKLRIILSNLGDKECPPQYLDKFIELIDCLRYILSYKPSSCDPNNPKKNLSLSKNQIQGCQKCNHKASFSETLETNPDEISNQKIKECNQLAKVEKILTNSESPKATESIQQIENCEQIKSDNNFANDSSDSDTYMGIPNVSLNRLISSKPLRSERYRYKKNRNKEKKHIKENRNENHNNYIQDRQFQDHYNSSVSITEEEIEKMRHGKRSELTADPFSSKAPIQNKYKNLTPENINKNDVKKNEINTASNLPLTPYKRTPKTLEKQRPTIKSYEPANLNIKIMRLAKNQNCTNSDVSIIDEPLNKLPNSNINNNSDSEDKLSEEILQHPFLTYDSEDFLEEDINKQVLLCNSNFNKAENKNSKIGQRNRIDAIDEEKCSSEQIKQSSPENKRNRFNSSAVKDEPFGSKENPKLLTSWVPLVIHNSELKNNLVFQGKLLNEAGYVLHRKYLTDPVYRRHSLKLIETNRNEYFMLIGEINNTKHVVPKELSKQCRTGCPTKIKEFCEEWIKIINPVSEKDNANKLTNLHNASLELLDVPTSSRGRRILPPLNYWNGERLATKDNNTVYIPGNIQEAVLATKTESFKIPIASAEDEIQKSNSKRGLGTKINKNIAENLPSDSKPKPTKKRIAQQLKYSSTDSDTEETTNKRILRRSKQQSVKGNSPTTHQSKKADTNKEILTESAYNVKLRKRQRLDAKEKLQQHSDVNSVKTRAFTKTALTWTYDKGQYNDILSDDQVSVINKVD